MKKQNTGKVIGVSLLAVVLVGMMGCDSGEDKDNTPGDPAPISGESMLRMHGNDYITNVYFDGAYLGTVAPGHTQDYSVPVGTHTLRFTNAERDHQKPGTLKIDFQANTIHPVEVRWKEESIL